MSRLNKLSVSLKGLLKEKLAVYVSAAAVFAVLICMSAFTLMSQQNADMSGFVFSLANQVIPERQYDVDITVDGKTSTVRGNGTVADMLALANIKMDEDDLINIGFNEKVNRNTEIIINRVVCLETVKVQTIDYATEYKEDPNIIMGYSEVLVNGEEGEKEVKIRHRYIDGELVSKEIISEEIVAPVVDKVVLTGTGTVDAGVPASSVKQISWLECPDSLLLDENGAPLDYSNVLTGKATAYSARPGAGTASGRTAMVGYVAVDPKIIPYGTELYIVSTDGKTVYGYAIAADTGTGLLEGVILVDVFMESYEASCDWGAKQVNIYVLD